MSRAAESAIFTASLAAALIVFFILAWRLESSGRLAPLLLSGAALALTTRELKQDWTGPRRPSGPASIVDRWGLAWALALPVALYLLGCVGGVLLHTVVFLRVRAQRSWALASLLAVVAALPVYGLAKLMARDELLRGVLLSWL